MARLILPSNLARRAVRQSGTGTTTRTRAGPITPHREEAATASQFVAAPVGLPEGFETAAKAAREDRLRARRMRRVLLLGMGVLMLLSWLSGDAEGAMAGYGMTRDC